MYKLKEIFDYNYIFAYIFKKISIYLIFVLLLSHFLFPQLAATYSSDYELTTTYLNYDLEYEDCESNNESEELEEVDIDDFVHIPFSSFLSSESKIYNDNLVSDFYYSLYLEKLSPPPKIS